jgi:hypothetical protein
MPLKVAGLRDALQKLFEDADDYPADDTAAGQRLANAYKTYAADAVAGATAPVALQLTAAETILAGALAAGFTAAKNAGPGGLAALLPLLDTAFVSFWLTPPVTFLVPIPPPTIAGVVTVAPPGVLSAGLAGPFASGASQNATAAQQAQLLAAVLDIWTRTVIVTNTPVTPPGPPVTVPLA